MTSKDDANKIKQQIEELLNINRITKGISDFTHVSMGGISFPGKFNFVDSKQRKILAKLISKAYEKGVYFSIAEKIKEYAPIMIDIDLRMPKDSETKDIENKRLYDDELIINIINIYRNSIKKFLNASDKELECFVFEKSKMGEKSEELADGIHMFFPYIVADTKIRHIVFKTAYDECIEEELFSQYSNTSSVLDDKIISTNPWLMYGCVKPYSEPYILTRIYDKDNIKLKLDNIISDKYELIRMLSLRESKWSYENATPYNTNTNDKIVEDLYSDIAINRKIPDSDMSEPTSEDKLEMVEKAMRMTDMLSIKRAESYHEWLRVGWALHNTHRCLLDTWINFSRQSKKYKDGECNKLWDNMKDDGYTLRSLMLWAKEDNPDEYKKFIKEDFENYLKKNSVSNTFMIAKALYSKYFDRFVCADIKNNIWYYFSSHRWNKCINGGTLITLMSSEFANNYILMSQEFNQKAMDAVANDKKSYLDQSSHFNKIAECLMDINFKEKVMKEARYIFHDEQFIKRLDENHHLIGFENGVYDLKLKKFRAGQPDDHISMSTHQQYIKWNENNPYAKHIKTFFEQVMPVESVRKYLLTRLSTCVSGENREEVFIFCIGSGSNGKSLTFQLVSEALGDYYISCPITIITRKRNSSNAASPELARMKGVRCGVYQEPGTDEEINVGIFKELSGNDKFMVRGLYSDPIEIRPQLKQFMTTNELPEIKSIDGGTWRRIRVIDFMSKFIEHPDPNNKYEFKLDGTLKDKISQWAPAFASYLIHIYTTMYDVDNKISEPEEVLSSTLQYRREQDVFRDYFESNIEITLNKKDIIKKKDLNTHFKMWYKNEHEGSTLPKTKALYEYFEKMLKVKYSNNIGYICIKFRKEVESSGEDIMEENDLDNP